MHPRDVSSAYHGMSHPDTEDISRSIRKHSNDGWIVTFLQEDNGDCHHIWSCRRALMPTYGTWLSVWLLQIVSKSPLNFANQPAAPNINIAKGGWSPWCSHRGCKTKRTSEVNPIETKPVKESRWVTTMKILARIWSLNVHNLIWIVSPGLVVVDWAAKDFVAGKLCAHLHLGSNRRPPLYGNV